MLSRVKRKMAAEGKETAGFAIVAKPSQPKQMTLERFAAMNLDSNNKSKVRVSQQVVVSKKKRKMAMDSDESEEEW